MDLGHVTFGPRFQLARWARVPIGPLGPGPTWPVGPKSQLAHWASVPVGRLGPGPNWPVGPGSQLARWAQGPGSSWLIGHTLLLFLYLFCISRFPRFVLVLYFEFAI